MVYLACDLGAESGRLMSGLVASTGIEIREIHRFANTPLRHGGSLYWDIDQLLAQLKVGLKKAAALKQPLASISTDSWGVDYVLLDAESKITPPAFHYRDPRSAQGVRKVLQHLNAKQIFGETGIQFMPINTLYQLGAESPERLARSSQLLLIADAFNFFLCGVAKAEESLASTTQLYNPQTRAWSRLLAGAVAVERLLPKVVSSGSRLGPLKSAISQETGLPVCEVVASCSHDTAAAVAAVPAEGGTWAFLSSGTWSLLGVEVAAPLLTEACRNLNFTNEIGFGGTIRLLKNIVGLWIVQECRRHWAAAGDDFGYEQLTAMAEGSAPFRSIFQPSDQRFLSPDDMPGKIAAYCQETSQPVPQTHGEIVRATLESLALLYGKTVRELETLIGKNILMLHIVGGGSRNALLNQFTANALDIPVLAGPAEATTTGNILVQAIATGEVQSLGEGRQLVRRSCALQRFEPRDNGAWTAAHERFEQLPYSQYSQPACE